MGPRQLSDVSKITSPPQGCIEGIRLDQFQVGFVYDVNLLIACLLVTEGWAEPAADGTPAHQNPAAPRLRAQTVASSRLRR